MTVHEEICYVGTGLAVPLSLHKDTAVIIKFRLAEQAYHTVCVCVRACRATVIYFTSISVSDYTASMMELLHDELGKDLSSNPGTIPAST